MSECLRCGLCCIACDIKWEEITEANRVAVLDRLRWLNLHRCDAQIYKQKDGKEFSVMRIPLICRQLDQDKNGKYFCKDYANRPNVCKEFKCLKTEQGVVAGT
jgi:Fe-S-cluster containining protein